MEQDQTSTPLLMAMSIFSGLNNGFNCSVMNGLIPRMKFLLRLGDVEEGILTSILFVGVLFGISFAGLYSNDNIGRKRTTVAGESVIIIGSIGQLIYLNFWTILSFRLLTGVGLGICAVTKPLYVSELSDRNVRGRVVACFSVAFSIGMISVFIMEAVLPDAESTENTFMAKEAWRFEVAFGLIPALILCVLVYYYIPESPVYLQLLNRNEPQVQRVDNKQKNATIVKRAIVLTFILSIGHQFSLMSIFMGRTREIIERMGCPHTSSNHWSTCLSLFHLIGILISLPIIDQIGRRALLLCSYTLGIILSSFLCIILLFSEENFVELKIILLCLYCGAYQLGISSTFYVIINETWPLHLRAKGMGLGAFIVFFEVTVITGFYPIYRESIHIGTFFGIASTSLIICMSLVWNYLPETRGVKIEEVEHMWEKYISKKQIKNESNVITHQKCQNKSVEIGINTLTTSKVT